MVNRLLTSSFRTFDAFFVICFTISMFICGDADCLRGKSNENCVSLLCSLLHKHASPSQNSQSGAGNECSCVCHVLTIIGPTFSFNYHPMAQYNTAIVMLQISSAPNRLVYHPPAAV
jgi:hypothetical protein